MAIYNLAWGVAVMPLLGALASFLTETQRRAAQVCVAFSGLGFVMSAIVLGVRLTHPTGAVFDNTLTFFGFSPPEGTVFATRFETHLGIHVDALSASFAAALAFAVVVVQSYALTAMRGDAAFRRFFWSSGLLGFAVCGFVLSPNLFDSLVMWVIASACMYLLTSQTWQHPDAAAHARRVMVALAVGDVTLTLGVLFTWVKFGVFSALLPAPTGQTAADPFSFTVVSQAAAATVHGAVGGAGLRTLVVIGILFLVAALVRTAQFPFHLWLTETAGSAIPVTALAGATVAPLGVYLLARMYPVLVQVPQVLTGVAIAGAAAAVVAAAIALAQRDIVRIAVFAIVTELGIALAALGTGGFSAGVFIAFTSVFFSVLLVLASGNLARVFRTRNIHEMGGAWSRLRTTSRALAVWAIGAGGLGLGAYYALSSAFANRTPTGGHIGAAARGAVIALVVVAAVLAALVAARLLVTVCSGEVARRRGFQHDRVADVEPSLRRPLSLALAAAVAAVLIGLPGIPSIHSGRTNVPGLTFNHFVFFGGARQAIGFDPLAMLLALVALGAAVAAGVLLFAPARRTRTAAMVRRAEPVARALARGLFVERAAHRVGRPVLALSARLGRIDDDVTAQLGESAAEGAGQTASALARARTPRLNLYLAAGLVATGVLALLSVLAATGHLWVHTL